MRGPHHNIFYYYRGPSPSPPNAEAEDRYQTQVEDNSTKALINVLDLGGATLVRSFLARFAPALVERWLPDVEPQLFLQGGPQSLPAGTRLLLGLSLLAQIDGPLVASGGGSRIDAAIVIPSAGMLAVEVKVVDDLDGPQLARHAERWGIEDPPLCARWADVWRWARAERERASDVQGFLLEQLGEYLEILGFAPWGGFRAEDFDYFTRPTLEQRAIVKNRLSSAWERILEGLSAQDRGALGVIHSGRVGLHDGVAWAQTNRRERGVNLSLELYGHELQLNLVGWNKPAAGRLLAWLCSEPEGWASQAQTRGARSQRNLIYKR